MLNSRLSPLWIIATKDIRDALRDHFVLIVTLFLSLAALSALVTGAIALRTDVATFEAAKTSLLALGKTADQIKSPEFYPLRLLRGAVEQIEIIGAAIGIMIGFRAAVSERGRQTLLLVLTRPVARWQFLAGKAAAGLLMIGAGLALVLVALAVVLHFVSGIGLGWEDLTRLALVWVAAVTYVFCFFLLSFFLTLHQQQAAHALLMGFAVWLMLVLIAPQIGDTLDPDNQVAGGVFKQLHIAKLDQIEIMKGFSGYESLRSGIEAGSITKHFERFSFAVLGIKDTYTGMPIRSILVEKTSDLIWIIFTGLGLGALLLAVPLNPTKLAKE